MLSSELRARLPGEVSLLTKQPGAKAINPQGLQRPRNLSALRKAMTLARFEYDHAPRPRHPSAWARNSAGPAVQFGATRNKRFVFLQKKKRQRRRAPLAASQGWSCKGTGRPCPERSNGIERRFALAPPAHWVGLEPGLEGDYGLCFFPICCLQHQSNQFWRIRVTALNGKRQHANAFTHARTGALALANHSKSQGIQTPCLAFSCCPK